MVSQRIKVGILAPVPETCLSLRNLVQATSLGVVCMESGSYCTSISDAVAQSVESAHPNILLVDAHDPKAALHSVDLLHALHPKTWLFFISDSSDPQLIIDSMRAGAREFLPKPIQPLQLSQAFERFISETERNAEGGAHGKVYAITSAKGGAGATTVAINLATAVASEPQTRVSLFDLNSPVGDVAAQLNLRPQFTISDVLAAHSRLDPLLLESFSVNSRGIAVLSGPKEYKAQSEGPEALDRMLRVAAQAYTHSFVDISSSIGSEHLRAVAERSAAILVVLTPELPSIYRTDRLVRFLTGVDVIEKVRLVINRDTKGTVIAEKEIEKILGQPIYWKLPNNYEACLKAINSGKPLITTNSSSLSISYYNLAHQLTGIPRQKRAGGGSFRFFS